MLGHLSLLVIAQILANCIMLLNFIQLNSNKLTITYVH
jgi:hypothetical protein